MALTKKGKYYYCDSADDLIAELDRYSRLNMYHACKTERLTCAACGRALFKLFSDEDENGAAAQCANCAERQFIRDSVNCLDENQDNFGRLCGNDEFHVAVGVSFYAGAADARWVYSTIGQHNRGRFCFVLNRRKDCHIIHLGQGRKTI